MRPKTVALRHVVALLMKPARDPAALMMIRALLDRGTSRRRIRRAAVRERLADRLTAEQSSSLGPRLRVGGSR